MGYTDISNNADIIDTRNIIERVEEIQFDKDNDPGNLTNESFEEFDQLTALLAEVRDYAADSPEDGVQLIRDTYFEQYARELADEIGDQAPTGWPYSFIDWPAAARELQTDYTSVDYGDVEYWVR